MHALLSIHTLGSTEHRISLTAELFLIIWQNIQHRKFFKKGQLKLAIYRQFNDQTILKCHFEPSVRCVPYLERHFQVI